MKIDLKNKKILLGITGSIAAYKTPYLIRELLAHGAEVKVIMTESAAEFVTPMTLANISRKPVIMKMFSEDTQINGAWHIHEAHNCDAMLIAPATATTIAKIANGICDSALVSVATALPADIPLIISPAMDSTMWLSPATQRNVETLRKDGCIIIPPDEGPLSSGMVGPGRFPDLGVIISYTAQAVTENLKRYDTNFIYEYNRVSKIEDKPLESLQESVDKIAWNADMELEMLKQKQYSELLKGKRVLITAGPTREKIDDVRYISNYSTGKMGYAIAEVAMKMGAEVHLISGPTNIEQPKNIKISRVTSSEEMYAVAKMSINDYDIAIFAAAVADYKPALPHSGKLKKVSLGNSPELKLIRTTDILAEFGKYKTDKQVLIGFALETENLIENAKSKLINKRCDIIVANRANTQKSGFGGDFNTITLIEKSGDIIEFEPMKKEKCAEKILQKAAQLSKKLKS